MGRSSSSEAATLRKKRLGQLLNLALAYKDCTRKELAKTLGRDPTKLVPGTGIPKLDLVVELAGVLDWPVGDVVAYLWTHAPNPSVPDPGGDFDSLDEAAARAHASGEFQLAAELARAAYAAAPTPRQRARACHRELLGWQCLGRYLEVVGAASRCLREMGTPPEFRRAIQSELANAYYAIWSLVESRAISRELLDAYREHPPQTPQDRRTHAFAHYLAGQTCRRLMSIEPQDSRALAASARGDLERALMLYRRLGTDQDDESVEGLANTCVGAMIEVDVELGRRRPSDALARLSAGLDRVFDTSTLSGDRLESYGWWCIFGCNIALRHLADERELQQHMAVFTNKADEIANQLDNWSMRERVFSMQYTRWERAADSTCFEIPCVIDSDDVRVITGTMGRFPTFRSTGWQILQTAQIVD